MLNVYHPFEQCNLIGGLLSLSQQQMYSMLKRLKEGLAIIFCIAFYGITAQKLPEFLLVGVFHRIPDSLACNWATTYQKIQRYHPDQIAVEEVIPSDTASLYHSIGEGYVPIWDSLVIAWEGKKINVRDSIGRYQQLLRKFERPEWRLNLWKYYHLGLDLGNREYQTYLIYKNQESYLAQLDTNSQWGKAMWIRYQRTIRFKKESEFFNLIYPLAQALDIKYLYPTDNRITFTAQSEAYEKYSSALEGTDAQSRADSFWKNFVDTEQREIKNCQALSFVNSPEWLQNTDYGQAHLLDDLKLAAYAEYTRVWYARNESIAERMIEAAIKSRAKKMVAFYGYMHISPVKKYLEARGYQVKLIGDLK